MHLELDVPQMRPTSILVSTMRSTIAIPITRSNNLLTSKFRYVTWRSRWRTADDFSSKSRVQSLDSGPEPSSRPTKKFSVTKKRRHIDKSSESSYYPALISDLAGYPSLRNTRHLCLRYWLSPKLNILSEKRNFWSQNQCNFDGLLRPQPCRILLLNLQLSAILLGKKISYAINRPSISPFKRWWKSGSLVCTWGWFQVKMTTNSIADATWFMHSASKCCAVSNSW